MERLPVSGTMGYFASEDGNIYDQSGDIVPTAVRKDGVVRVKVKTTCWKEAWRSVARLILDTFDPSDTADWLSVRYLDGNKQNVSLDNLEWDSSLYIPTVIPGITAKPDAYVQIPGHRKYEIDLHGHVRHVKTGKLATIKLLPEGRFRFRIEDDDGRPVDMYYHRLVALTFLRHPKDTAHLVINHKDGDKANNALFNLEWTTSGENNRHAFETGLRLAKAVLLKNISTGEEVAFPTIRRAAESLGLKPNYLAQYLPGKGVMSKFSPVKKLYMVKYIDDPEPWPLQPRSGFDHRHHSKVIVKHISTGSEKIYGSIREASMDLGYDVNTLKKILGRTVRNYPEVYRDIMLQPYDADVKWPKYPAEIVAVFRNMKNASNPVKVTDLRDSTVTFWPGVKYWWRHMLQYDGTLNDPAVICRSIKIDPVYRYWKFESIDLKDYAYAHR